MNEKEEKKTTNSVLFENEQYNKAVDSLKAIIAKRDETIGVLSKQIGEKDQVISSYIDENDKEKAARIAAESKVVEQKDLKVETSGRSYSPKTEEEKFTDSFEKE